MAALKRTQQLLPFPLLGIDTDNGAEFINVELLSFCEQEHITFTRGRPQRSNDQCYGLFVQAQTTVAFSKTMLLLSFKK